MLEKLLHEPTEQLKALPDQETQAAYTEALNRLFRLSELESDDASSCSREERTAVSRIADDVNRPSLRAMTPLRIGTRGSELARFQANAVAALLHQTSGASTEIVIIKTSGDRLAEATLSEIGGKRLFVKENRGRPARQSHRSRRTQQQGHAGGAARRAAHRGRAPARGCARRRSCSPLRKAPTVTDGSIAGLARVLGREPRIGTSSVRRSAQLRRLWPAARFLPVRGNLDTRLRKLDEGQYDALVLAAPACCGSPRRPDFLGLTVRRLCAGAGAGDHRHRNARR
jgi:hypothetical protein